MLSRQCSGGTAIPTSTPKPCKNRPGSQHAGGVGGGFAGENRNERDNDREAATQQTVWLHHLTMVMTLFVW